MSKESYDKIYLSDVRRILGCMCQYSVDNMGVTLEEILNKFRKSEYAKGIEIGNPHYLCGFAGKEIARRLYKVKENLEVYIPPDVEYWIGWALAYVQWYTGKSFDYILKKMPVKDWYHYYGAYHEMSDTHLQELARIKVLGKKPRY